MKWIDRQINEPSKDDIILVWETWTGKEDEHYSGVSMAHYLRDVGHFGIRCNEGEWFELWSENDLIFRYWQPLPESPYEEKKG